MTMSQRNLSLAFSMLLVGQNWSTDFCYRFCVIHVANVAAKATAVTGRHFHNEREYERGLLIESIELV